MKIIKKLLFILLIACLSVTLFGCGKSAQEKHKEALNDAYENLEREEQQLEKQQREYDDLNNKIDNIKKRQNRLSN